MMLEFFITAYLSLGIFTAIGVRRSFVFNTDWYVVSNPTSDSKWPIGLLFLIGLLWPVIVAIVFFYWVVQLGSIRV